MTVAPGVGALRLRTVAAKPGAAFPLRDEAAKYLPWAIEYHNAPEE
jgi:hypothetical protein